MINKKNIIAIAALALLVVAFAIPAGAVQLKFHGDLNNRALLGTDHYETFKSPGFWVGDPKIDSSGGYDNSVEIKYRLWFEAVSDDDQYKGVVGTEFGALHFGAPSKLDYSGDDLVFELLRAYFDFQLPFTTQKSRVRIGLQPINVNYFLWKENVGGVKLYGDAGSFDYQLGWMRGYEAVNNGDLDADLRNDQDAVYGRLDMKTEEGKLGFLALYQWNNIDKVDQTYTDPDTNETIDYSLTPKKYQYKNLKNKQVDASLISLGIDGSKNFDPFFVKWDLIYQNGSFDNLIYEDLDGNQNAIDDYDLNAYFVHVDLGARMGKSTLTYTFWLASGDDDPYDDDLDAFMCTDVDMFDNIILFEGGYSDDNYITEHPYLLDRGFIMNKLALDYQATEKLKIGVAGMYMLTAEDVEYTTSAAFGSQKVSDDEIGFEIDVYLKYKLFKNVELAINAGYLAAGDAMDYLEVDAIKDGDTDENLWRSDMRIRYKF